MLNGTGRKLYILGYYSLKMELLSNVGGKDDVGEAGCQLHFTLLTDREDLIAFSCLHGFKSYIS
jgi:hypothetical protein